MTSHPHVWLVTHEQHLDPRIWKFARVFLRAGASVTYFPAPEKVPAELAGCRTVGFPTSDAEPTVVPEAVDCLDSATGSALLRIRDIFSKSGKKGLPSRTLLGNDFNDVRTKFRRLEVASTGAGQCVLFTTSQGTDYCFEPASAQLWKIDTQRLSRLELAVRAGLARLSRENTLALDDVISSARAIEPTLRYARNGNLVTVEQPNGWDPGFRYSLELVTGHLRRTNLPPRYSRGADTLGDLRYDFGSFKVSVYDYTQLLGVVKEFLATHPDTPAPTLIYVADLPTLPIGVLLKRKYPGSKLIVDCHEWWREQEAIWNPDGVQRIKAIDVHERDLYSACDMRITVGEELAKAMQADLKQPFETVYTCVFDEPPAQQSAEERAAWRKNCLGVPGDTKIALFQGSLTEKRNLEALMRSTRYMREDQRLVVVGDGPFRGEMEKMLHRDGCSERVIFTGWVAQERLIDFTLAADIGIIPYKAYSPYYALSMPNKLAEYHACHLPIIAGKDLVEISRIIETDKIGVSTETGAPEMLGGMVAKLLDDQPMLDHWRANYEKSPERFTFRAFDSHVGQLVGQLL
jgi:glycosyltransferase involved in cell wall biosynthesis